MSRFTTGKRLVLTTSVALVVAGLMLLLNALSRPAHHPPVAPSTIVHPATTAPDDPFGPSPELPGPVEPLHGSPPALVITPAAVAPYPGRG